MADSDAESESSSSSSESRSHCSMKSKLYDFILVKFINKGRKRKIQDIDIVPSNWINFSDKRGKLVTKFMKQPYSEEDKLLLHSLVKNKIAPPSSWPIFSVELKGRAKTYEEGLQKLTILQTEDNAFTLGSEESASEIQKHLTIQLKRQKFQDDSEKLKQKLFGGKNIVQELPKCDEPSEIISLSSKPHISIPKDELLDPLSSTITILSPSMPSTSQSIFLPETMFTSATSTSQMSCDASLVNQVNLEAIENVSNNDFKSDSKTIIAHLIDIKSDLKEIKKAQDEQSTFLLDKKIIRMSSGSLEKKYKIEIPLPTMEAFEEFENKLKSELHFKNDVYIELQTKMDKDYSISRSITNILKSFLTKPLAMQFTATRLSSDKSKIRFKPTELCQLMDVVIIKKRKEKSMDTSPSDLVQKLTDVLSNVKKWSK